ncbi:hypothetical protein BpHYR1_033573 [Brachionus plicatilis]|uniref:Uncharacterized protein n=1 Tax=Brachionus plicatilis TaxID=10195 RepID=A0A3M7RYI8_BRAPC|nr:hypothetical protein BpHYR1_033573 [Brachionus plicatilis]
MNDPANLLEAHESIEDFCSILKRKVYENGWDTKRESIDAQDTKMSARNQPYIYTDPNVSKHSKSIPMSAYLKTFKAKNFYIYDKIKFRSRYPWEVQNCLKPFFYFSCDLNLLNTKFNYKALF